MFICKKCNAMFDEPLSVKVNQSGRGEVPYYERESCCPACGSPDIIEAKQCFFCGEYFDPEELSLILYYPKGQDLGKPEWSCPSCRGAEDD
jgi:hypothetical protein